MNYRDLFIVFSLSYIASFFVKKASILDLKIIGAWLTNIVKCLRHFGKYKLIRSLLIMVRILNPNYRFRYTFVCFTCILFLLLKIPKKGSTSVADITRKADVKKRKYLSRNFKWSSVFVYGMGTLWHSDSTSHLN